MRGIASIYWPGDGHSGSICADGKPFTRKRCHLAHRFWPLGRRVEVCSLQPKGSKNGDVKHCVVTYVGDRGPFGACDKKGINPRTLACRGKWLLKIRKEDPGQWRGVADLSRCVARGIGHDGLSYVQLTLLPRGSKRKLISWEESQSKPTLVSMKKPIKFNRAWLLVAVQDGVWVALWRKRKSLLTLSSVY